MSTETNHLTQPRRALYSRAFRPLSWWIVISAVLLAWEYHRTHALRTTLTFGLTIEGKPVDPGVACSASVNNRAVMSGSVVPIGWRSIRVEAADAEPVQKSLFIWYGENSAGEINLPWSRGVLDMSIDPPAQEVRGKGPHHSFSLAGSSGKTVTIPVGHYEITARFEHFSEPYSVTVARNETNWLVIKPVVGAVSVVSDPPGAQFRLASVIKRDVAAEGTAPMLIRYLPESEYRLSIWRGEYLKEMSFAVKQGETNAIKVPFEYGTVTFASDPSGATIFRDGKEVGQTPATLSELRLGRYNFRLQKEGFQPVEVPIEVQSTNSITVSTNLVSLQYSEAMVNARLEAVRPSPDYQRALRLVEQALKAKPGDAEALTLRDRLENGLQEAERNQVEREKQRAAQKQQEELEARRRALAEKFHNATRNYAEAELFDTHQFEFRSDVATVRAAVLRAVRKTSTKWGLQREDRLNQNNILLHFTPSAILTLGRHCFVLVSEFGPGEVHVHAKFWDYVGMSEGTSILDAIIPDKTVAVHRKFFKPEQAAAVDQRRRDIAENFRRTLENELR
ncbi:MAG: PEGA domain-containing protein [Verrucomicrobia bacterium]|nr:PEGA domain-containing protein [Verrucomicrobiota bacterium]